MDRLPCQKAFLCSRQDHKTAQGIIRIYRCEAAGELCAISGDDLDEELLLTVCADCAQKPADLEQFQAGGLSHV